MKALVVCLVSFLGLTAASFQDPPDFNPAKMERLIADSINSERRTGGVDELRMDAVLSGIARSHSEEMARIGYFDHTNPEGRDPKDRVRAAGYECKEIAENISRTKLYSKVTTSGNRKSYDWYTPEQVAAAAVKVWISKRDDHRNILEKKYQKTGMGVAISDDVQLYVTEIFCSL